MKTIDLQKEWNFVISEIHKEKPKANNILKRELLFIIQNLLTQISEKPENKEEVFLQKIYLKTKGYYFAM